MNARKLSVDSVGRLAVAMAVVLAGPVLLGVSPARADLAAVVNSMPNCDKDGKYTGPAREVAQQAVDQVLKGGKANIIALVGMLKEADKAENYKARYVLHATTTYVSRRGGQAQRRMVSEALASTLAGQAPPIVKAHVLEELKWIGGKESVDAIAPLLLDDKLYDFAVQALVASKSAGPIRAALGRGKGPKRVAMIQALGTIRDAASTPALIKLACGDDADARLAAIDALGNIGDPRATDIIIGQAKIKKGSFEEMRIAEAALRLGGRLAQAGEKDKARRIYATLSAQSPGKAGRHIRSGCLWGLAGVGGDEVVTELLAAISDPDPQVRAVATQVAATLPRGKAVDKWLALLKNAKPKDRAGILFVLGFVGDARAAPAVIEAMDDPDQAIRLQAIRSAAGIGGEQAAAALVARATRKKGVEQAAALAGLIKCRGPAANAAVGTAAKKASDPAARAALIGVLAARRAGDQMPTILAALGDRDASVRTAAAAALGVVGGAKEVAVLAKMLKAAKDRSERQAAEQALLAIGSRARDQVAGAVIPAIEGADAEAAAAMFRVLARGGGDAAAKALTTCTSSADRKIADEALRALAGWSEGEGIIQAADGLLKIASTATDPKQQAIALRGYVNLARSRHWGKDTGQRLKICGEALKAAKGADQKRSVLGVLSGIYDAKAVQLSASCLGDPGVAEEAAAAVVRVVNRLRNKNHRDVQAALRRVVQVSKNKQTVRQAKRFLRK